MTEVQRRIARARLLRREGKTYDEIRAVVGPVSDDCLKAWLAGIPRPPQTHRSRPAKDLRVECRRLRLQGRSYSEIAALYWAEGSKSKPWRPTARQIVLTNSDVDVVRAFLVWLDLMLVPETERTYRLHIHESVAAELHERWWAEQLAIPLSSFMRPTLKRHKPTTVRRNTGDLYHGCLVVRVKRSAGLYDQMEGMWLSLARAAAVRSLGAQQSRVV